MALPTKKKVDGPGAVIEEIETGLKLTRPRKAIQPQTLDLLQEQIKHELFAERLYYSIATWCDWKGFPQTAKWFSTHATEEHKHAMSFVNFIQQRGEHALFPDTEQPTQEFDSMMDVIDAALDHEYFITDRINNLYAMAMQEKDGLALQIARKYLEEQTEEEQLFLSLKKWLEVNGEPGPDWEIEVMSIHDKSSHTIGQL
jgi:ferritin